MLDSSPRLALKASLWTLGFGAMATFCGCGVFETRAPAPGGEPGIITETPLELPPSGGEAPSDARPSEDHRALREIISRAPQEEADTAPNGDLLHVVGETGESFSDIALWYTFERGNGARLARIHGRRSDARPMPGDRVTIPRYLVKNRVRPPRTFVEDLADLPREAEDAAPSAPFGGENRALEREPPPS